MKAENMVLPILVMFCAAGWCVDDAVLTGKVIDSTNAPVADLNVRSRYPWPYNVTHSRTVKTNAAGIYYIHYRGDSLLNYKFFMYTDTVGTMQHSKDISVDFPPNTEHFDQTPDTIHVPDFKVPRVPGPYDAVVITGKVCFLATTGAVPGPDVPVKIRWKRKNIYDSSYALWDTLKATTDAAGVFLYTAPNRFLISRVTCWVDTTPGICYASKSPVADSLPSALDVFDGKKDSINVRKTIYVKPDTTDTTDTTTVLDPSPHISSHSDFRPVASRISVSFYGLDGRLIRRVGEISSDNLASVAASICPGRANTLIAVWRENGKQVSRRINPALHNVGRR